MGRIFAVIQAGLVVLLVAQIAPLVALADEPTPQPTPKPIPIVVAFTPEQQAQVQAIAQATSLGLRIEGIDVAAPLGTPVFAVAAGQVAFAGHLADGGLVVLLAHDAGLFTLSAHLDDRHAPPPVKIGDAVKAGDPIGVIGLTGITTGAHLHFVIRRGDEPIDPTGMLPPF